MRKNLLFALSVVAGLQLAAAVTPATVFSDHMVLQQGRQIPVWGSADPGEKVEVSFAGQKVSATAGSDGKWHLFLEPLSASKLSRTMTVQGKNNKVEVKDILVGEVWLCSGQSNMEMRLWHPTPARPRSANGDKAAAKGANPHIRIVTMHVDWKTAAETDVPVKWEALNSENAIPFSAVAFYFGHELFNHLDVPVGLVASHWGGSKIEPWIPPAGFDSVPELKDFAYNVNAKLPGTPEYKEINGKALETYSKWLAEAQKAFASGSLIPTPPAYPAELLQPTHRQLPTVIYNHMIHPLVPFAFRGVIWYQGCSNLSDGLLYQHKMQALLNGWRKLFNTPNMPFYFVQLAPYRYGSDPYKLPVLWQAQHNFAKANGEEVAMAVINDVGDFRDIHPTNKKTVGIRLSLLALKHTYGKNLKADSPEVDSWQIKGNKFAVKFKHVEKFQGKPEHFEIADAFGTWFPASVTVNGNELLISSPQVDYPQAVRYLWHHTKAGTLFNEAGLPLGSFICKESGTKEQVFDSIRKKYQLIYRHDMLKATPQDGSIKYLEDNSDAVKGKVKRVIYVADAVTKTGENRWVAVAFDSFSADVKKVGVPVFASKVITAQKVRNLQVSSNVPGVKNGIWPEGNIEFYACNYNPGNQKNIPGANSQTFDFGDAMSSVPENIGHGAMQIHNFMEKQTVFAYNNFRGRIPEVGFGNNSQGKNPDWTHSQSAALFKKADLMIFVEVEF